MKIVISSGHGRNVSGARSIIDEVTEARRVTARVAEYLCLAGVDVVEFHENIATSQAANVNSIVRFHNSQKRDLDISIHFNAFSKTDAPRGTEVLYYSEETLSKNVANAISAVSGLKNRGAKKRVDLGFLNGTAMPAILIEVCFVDSVEDVRIYRDKFDEISKAIAEAVSGKKISFKLGEGQENEGEKGNEEKGEGAKGIESENERDGGTLKRYNTIDELKDYMKPTIQKLIDKGYLSGDGQGFSLSEDMIRIFVVNDRAGLYE